MFYAGARVSPAETCSDERRGSPRFFQFVYAAAQRTEDVAPGLHRRLEDDTCARGVRCRRWHRPPCGARHPRRARLARKLWSFFISEIQAPDESFVARIAGVYASSDGPNSPVVRAVLTSPQFDARDMYFARFSWPAEFVVRALKEVGCAGFTLNSALGPLSNMASSLRAPEWREGTGAAWVRRLHACDDFGGLTSRQRKDNCGRAAEWCDVEALLSSISIASPATFEQNA